MLKRLRVGSYKYTHFHIKRDHKLVASKGKKCSSILMIFENLSFSVSVVF